MSRTSHASRVFAKVDIFSFCQLGLSVDPVNFGYSDILRRSRGMEIFDREKDLCEDTWNDIQGG